MPSGEEKGPLDWKGWELMIYSKTFRLTIGARIAKLLARFNTLTSFDLFTLLSLFQNGPLLLHLFYLSACKTLKDVLESQLIFFPQWDLWGQSVILGVVQILAAVDKVQGVLILEQVLAKHGIAHLKIVPNLKEGELVNGSHGKKHMI